MRIPCLAVFAFFSLVHSQQAYTLSLNSNFYDSGNSFCGSFRTSCSLSSSVNSTVFSSVSVPFASCFYNNPSVTTTIPVAYSRISNISWSLSTAFNCGYCRVSGIDHTCSSVSKSGTADGVSSFYLENYLMNGASFCSEPSIDGSCSVSFDVLDVDCEGADAGNEFLCPKNPYCASTEEEAQALLASARQECLSEQGAVFSGGVGDHPGRGWCVTGSCNDCGTEGIKNYLKDMAKSKCCEANEEGGFEPNPVSNACSLPIGGIGITGSILHYEAISCSSVPAGGGDNACNFTTPEHCESSSDPELCLCTTQGIGCGDGGSSDSGSSSGSDNSSGSGSSDSGEGNSSDSSGSSNSGGNSSGSGGSSGSGSDSSNSGGSSGSGGSGGNSSGSGGSSGSSGDDGGGSSGSGSSNGSGGDSGSSGSGSSPGGGNSSGSGDGGISCEDLKNCDWSTLEKQLVQLDVEKEIRDSLKNLLQWLKYKSREDSLISLMRWSAENEDRKKMIEISETLNGRIFTYQAEQNRQFQKMDSLNGLYYSASLSASSANKRSLDSLRSELAKSIGDGSDAIVDAINGLGMSGVEDGLDKVSSKIDKSNSLLGKLDSTLSAGNGRLLAALDSLSGPCAGIQCGDYDGVDDGAFSGLDTSGFSRARWDSLLSVPGSGGIQDSAAAWSNRLRAATATPFVDGMACPAADLSVNFCEWFGGRQCIFSLCDQMFYVKGRHFFEWIGVFAEFTAWVLFLVRVA